MLSKKINFIVVPFHGTGAHFILWSMYFLSGQTLAYSSTLGLIPVFDFLKNNLKKNFHRQSAYEVTTVEEAIELVNNFPDVPVINVYVRHRHQNTIALEYFNRQFTELNPDETTYVLDLQSKYIDNLLQWIQSNNYPLVFVDLLKEDYLATVYNNRFQVDLNQVERSSQLDVLKSYHDCFFKKSNCAFDTNVWDLRESLAINLQLERHKSGYNYVNKIKPHLYLNSDDIWNFFDSKIQNLLEFCNLQLDKTKLPSWQQVYNRWRLNLRPEFSRNIDYIVNSIIQGYYADLSSYNMAFEHETIIQAKLIQCHNLNFKTWQLEKFPSNTQDLHKLLEPNIHTI